jgi:hypothetical protein
VLSAARDDYELALREARELAPQFFPGDAMRGEEDAEMAGLGRDIADAKSRLFQAMHLAQQHGDALGVEVARLKLRHLVAS